MKKTWTLVVIVAILAALGTFYCGGGKEQPEALVKEYEALQVEMGKKLKAVDSKDAMKQLRKEKKQKEEALLAKVNAAGDGDSLLLLKGKLLYSLRKPDEALAAFNQVIGKNSPLAADAKFEKLKILQRKGRDKEALALYKEIEPTIEKDDNYYRVVMEFAFNAPDTEDRIKFSKLFIEGADNTEGTKRMKGYVFQNLAGIMKDKGDLAKAMEILETAIKSMEGTKAVRSLEAALKQLKMVGQPAPEISAENWLNSEALSLAGLKGKAVAIDFWAPWCPPCRAVMPTIVKKYEELKDKGLVVIGFTKLYGRYSDDKENLGQVPPEKEKELVGQFVERFKLTYPIAIADKGTAFEAYAVTGIPTMVLIDKEGIVRDIRVGSGDEEKLAEELEKLVQ